MISKGYQIKISMKYPKISCQISNLGIRMISKDIPRYPSIFIFPVRPTCHSRWERSDYVRSSRRPFWQKACPFFASWDHFRPCMLQYHRCPAGLPKQLGCCHGPEAWRSSTRPVWRPGCQDSASGAGLAALHHLQNLYNRFEMEKGSM